jgi:hypothetical protein
VPAKFILELNKNSRGYQEEGEKKKRKEQMHARAWFNIIIINNQRELDLTGAVINWSG